MTPTAPILRLQQRPDWSAALELLKPITWFAPMWAFWCGVVSSGVPLRGHGFILLAGVLLAGPMVCATSQAVNDWFDRGVDAINEPNRPIPSGRVPGHWGLVIAIGWTLLSLLVATLLGRWGFAAAVLGLLLAWAYSAPPLRLKRDGWCGNSAVALCYEGLPWLTGAAVMTGQPPIGPVVALALLYSLGAHGIMTLNDFKSIEGDRRTGIASLPARLGVDPAARVACLFMAGAQLGVVLLLLLWHQPIHALVVAALLGAQAALMLLLLRRPGVHAARYNATGTTLYVLGMLTAACAVPLSFPTLP